MSTDQFYTSDYDLSKYAANQYRLGRSYTAIFTKFHVSKFGLKRMVLKGAYYDKDDTLRASILSAGFKFLMDC